MASRPPTLGTLLALGATLALSGCGCGDDRGGSVSTAAAASEQASFAPGSVMPPCPLPPPEAGEVVRQIDVFFLLDDGATMENILLGLIPTDAGDTRTRTEGAQAIMQDIEQNLLADLAARFPGETFDLAIGVGRYEDYGGAFAETGRGFAGDAVARPFILQMPVLRRAHPRFAGLFTAALQQATPGDGRRIEGGVFERGDPNTGIEALFQIATGVGLDGNGDADTTDSGGPCSVLSQTAPGTSGDVPAVTWTGTADGSDPDGRPEFFLRDEDGVVTMIDDPLAPGTDVPCPASGNLGGVGWRNDAIRFVVLSSDRATVAPFAAAFPPTPVPDERAMPLPCRQEQLTIVPARGGNLNELPRGITPPGDPAPEPLDAILSATGEVLSTLPPGGALLTPTGDDVGPDDGPRESFTVPIAAFDAGPDHGRFGAPGGAVSPAAGATVLQAICALNDLHIEVFCIGSPDFRGNSAKPNGGDVPIPAASIPPINSNPAAFGLDTLNEPTDTPWTWMSGTSLLTGSAILYPNPLTNYPELAAVYNIGNVAPFGEAVTPDVREDIVQRAAAWLGVTPADDPDDPPAEPNFWTPLVIGGGTGEIAAADLPIVRVPVTLTPSAASDLSGFLIVPGLGPETIEVEIPVYVSGEAAPPSGEFAFGALLFNRADAADDADAPPLLGSVRYEIRADFAQATFESRPGADLDVYGDLVEVIERKLAGFQEPVLFTDARVDLTLEKVAAQTILVPEGEVPPAPDLEFVIPEEVVLGTVFSGCGALERANHEEAPEILPVGPQPCIPVTFTAP